MPAAPYDKLFRNYGEVDMVWRILAAIGACAPFHSPAWGIGPGCDYDEETYLASLNSSGQQDTIRGARTADITMFVPVCMGELHDDLAAVAIRCFSSFDLNEQENSDDLFDGRIYEESQTIIISPDEDEAGNRFVDRVEIVEINLEDRNYLEFYEGSTCILLTSHTGSVDRLPLLEPPQGGGRLSLENVWRTSADNVVMRVEIEAYAPQSDDAND